MFPPPAYEKKELKFQCFLWSMKKLDFLRGFFLYNHDNWFSASMYVTYHILNTRDGKL